MKKPNHILPIFLLALVVGCSSSKSPSSAKLPATAPSSEPVLSDAEGAILSDAVQLTRGFGRAGEAYFSHDMKWIIFQASPVGQEHYQMYIARVIWKDGSIAGAGEPTRINPPNSRNTCGFFSPVEDTILFASTAGKEKPDEPESGYQRQGRNYRWAFPAGMEIYRFDGWQKAVTDAGPGGSTDLARHALTNNTAYDAECAFSPDGKWICYTSMSTGEGDVYVMKADGTGSIRITTSAGYDGGPFFSPDGKRLVYRSDRNHNDLLQIFVADLRFDAAGNINGVTEEHQLTNDENVNWCPFWHPDGKHLIFATSRNGHDNYELYMIRDDGSHALRITNKAGPDILPVFSPDGKYLMWTNKRGTDHTAQIFAAKFKMPEGS